MANTLTIKTQSAKNRYLLLTCTQTPDRQTNTSQIKWKLEALDGPDCATGPIAIYIGGQMAYYKEFKDVSYPYFPVHLGSASGKVTVPHKPDGTLHLQVVMEAGLNYGLPEVYEEYWMLEPIDRTTIITAGSGIIGGGMLPLTMDRADGSFTHTIAYTFGSLSGWLNQYGEHSDTPVQVQGALSGMHLPQYFYYEIPDADHGVGQLTCTTYNGGKEVGVSVCSFTVNIDRQICEPRVFGQVRDCNPKTVALTGDDRVLVRYLSDAKCDLTAEAQMGASIAYCAIAGKEGESRVITGCQTDSIRFAVRDSRGMEADYVATAAMIPYEVLTCNVIFKRLDPLNGRAKLTIWGDCFYGDFGQQENTVTLSCPQLQVPLIPERTARGYRVEVELEGYEYDDRHTIYVTAQDFLMSVTTRATLPEGLPTFDWGRDDFHFHVPVVTDQSVGGIFLRSERPGSRYLRFQSRFLELLPDSTEKQSVFLFGMTENGLVQGTVLVGQDGTVQWLGTEGVSVQMSDSGRVVLTLPGVAVDGFCLLSATEIQI